MVKGESTEHFAKCLVCLATAMILGLPLTSNASAGGFRPERQTDDPRAAVRLLNPRGIPKQRPVSTRGGVVAGTALQDAVGWLGSTQNPSGSWGSAFEFVDTATVVGTLGRVQRAGGSFKLGAGWLTGQSAADNDELSRQILALQYVTGVDIEDLVNTLLASRNPSTTDPSTPNFPEGGWGLDFGYETDSLTTALALMALEGTDLKGGMGVVDEALAASDSNVHEWEIPADATGVRIVITVGSSEVLLRMTEGAPPTGADPFVTLAPGGPHEVVFPDSLPFTPGANFISIESPDPPGLGASYTFTASYETPDFDTRSFAEALDYLRRAQNAGGGWGIQTGDATSFYTTLHVLLALTDWQDYDFEVELSDGIDYLLSQQLPDGSFGYSGTPLPYMTALGARALVRYEVCPFSTATESAIAALLGQQNLDGSWDQEPYDTGLALLALWEYDNDGDGVFQDGDCSGTVGDNICPEGVTTGCDDNCIDYFNTDQASVVFGQNLEASNDETLFSWPDPVDIEFVKGDPADLSTYTVTMGGTASFASSIYTGGDVPTLDVGFYYLVRLGGDCTVSSWQSSLGAEPGRDSALP